MGIIQWLPEYRAEEFGRIVDPEFRVLGDGIATAAAAAAGAIDGGILVGEAQRMGLVDLGLVQGQPEQSSGSVSLSRR